jgi:hypothetical protein
LIIPCPAAEAGGNRILKQLEQIDARVVHAIEWLASFPKKVPR